MIIKMLYSDMLNNVAHSKTIPCAAHYHLIHGPTLVLGLGDGDHWFNVQQCKDFEEMSMFATVKMQQSNKISQKS